MARAYKTGNISETVEDKAKVTINGPYKSYTGFRLSPKCMTLNDLWTRFTDVCSNPYLFIVFSVFSISKRSWNGPVGTSLVDLLRAGLSQSHTSKLLGLSESGSTLSQKSEPPKHFATATANLHRFKWNFTHTRRRIFLSLTPNFIRIPHSVYRIFNFFKLLSQISVTVSHSFSMVTSSPSSRTVHQPTVPVRRLCYCQLKHTTSSATGLATEQSRSQSSGLWFGAFCRNGSTLPDPWCRPSERTTDWRVA